MRTGSPHVVVIGGGIAGLSAAYALQEQARLARRPLSCTLIEARERLGG
ncbi:MAG: FAD-dependent oxidoreductase, partial [Candidatus Tectomicrobia bacterium]|nr:FAD-dependent oxidoreductase [Candidatus Tectomicrobia bacterium]